MSTDPNPLLTTPGMTGTPYGIQPFAAIRPEHYLPALEAVLSQREARVRAIAQNPDPPGFANTVEALELSGGQLQYLHDAFTHQVTAGGCAELAAVEQDFAVRLSRHEGRIVRNRQLATRIEAVYAQRGELDAQPAALVEFWRR
ncbi:hypothetical protein ACQ4WX_00010 [Streptomyces lasalocidi]